LEDVKNQSLTCTVTGSITNGTSSLISRAGLVGAVANTVTKVGVVTVADNITTGTTKVGLGNADHVVEAGLLHQEDHVSRVETAGLKGMVIDSRGIVIDSRRILTAHAPRPC
jgi:hypothetical protein